MTAYRFCKTKNGITSFASLSIESVDQNATYLIWAENVAKFASRYEAAVKSGIDDAMQWHVESGGKPVAFRVVDFTELLVDTKMDAVRCAATFAAWLELGHLECQLSIEWKGEWQILRNESEHQSP